MKYIFDFDDVLFNDTTQFKKHMYSSLSKIGISEEVAIEYYKKVRTKGFSLRNYLSVLFYHCKIKKIRAEKLHEQIMEDSKKFGNKKLVKLIKKLGKSNCYLVTFGDKDHQLGKIKAINVATLFSKIFIVKRSKKFIVEKICTKHKNEKVIFIDDKNEHFENLDYAKYPNLKTILYTGQTIENLLRRYQQKS